jgi:serine/threonine protein kinase
MSKYAKAQSTHGNVSAQGQGMLVRDPILLKALYLQLIEGVVAMHVKGGVAHMDIKLENILISEEGVLKFCDFSFSTPINSYLDRKMGSKAYMAPEIYEASRMPCKASTTDIFSLGVLFFMMAFGAPPFAEATMNDGYFSFIKLRPGNNDFFKFHPHTR